MNHAQASDYFLYRARSCSVSWTDDSHILLINAAEGRPGSAIALANYREAFQLSLDCNLPPHIRRHWENERRVRALDLAATI